MYTNYSVCSCLSVTDGDGCSPPGSPCLPGIYMLGQGFDSISLTYTGDAVLNLSMPGPRPVAAFGGYGPFTVPEEATVVILNKHWSTSSVSNGSQQLSAAIAGSFNIKPGTALGVGSASAQFQTYFDSLSTSDVFLLEERYDLFEVTLGTYDKNGKPYIDSAFNSSVSNLPAVYDNTTQVTYFNFVSTWGTHWIWRLVYGLSTSITTRISRCSGNFSVNAGVELTAAWQSASGNVNENVSSSYETLLRSSAFEASGGNRELCLSVTQCNWTQFALSLNSSNLVIVAVMVQPLSDLPLPSAALSANLLKATLDYQAQRTANASTPLSCPQTAPGTGVSYKSISTAALIIAVIVAVLILVVLVALIWKAFSGKLKCRPCCSSSA